MSLVVASSAFLCEASLFTVNSLIMAVSSRLISLSFAFPLSPKQISQVSVIQIWIGQGRPRVKEKLKTKSEQDLDA